MGRILKTKLMATTVPLVSTPRVARNPKIQGGEPTVRGTRTTVRSVVLVARETGGLAGVLRDYPHLNAEDVADALAYYEQHREEIDGLIREFGDGDG